MPEPARTGLSPEAVEERIRSGEVNTEPKEPEKNLGLIIIENSLTVFNLVNFGLISVLVFFWIQTRDDRLFLDSLGVLLVVFLNTLMAIIQEYRTHRMIRDIQLLKNQDVTVLRDDKEQIIHRESIVKDDLIVLRRGDQVPVDGPLLTGHLFETDESLMTGESESIRKNAGDPLISGSYCVFGEGLMRAETIGAAATVHQIHKMARRLNLAPSPLQKRINLIFTGSFAIAIALIAIDFFVSGTSGLPVNEMIRKMATIAFTLIPEGLVFYASVTFLLGIWRIGKSGALVQKMQALDTMATMDIIAFDKTGTLTLHQSGNSEITYLSDEKRVQHLLGGYIHFSTHKTAVIESLSHFEPMSGMEKVSELAFDSSRKFSQVSLSNGKETNHLILGGFDVLEPVCQFNDGYQRPVSDTRLLIFGKIRNSLSDGQLPEFIEPLALISIQEQINPHASLALSLFREQNIRTLVISGDAPGTVRQVMKSLGEIIHDDEILTGSDLTSLSDPELEGKLDKVKVLARVTPDQKLRVIRLLRHRKLVTGMVGDGVNDLPAIREANLGIAMSKGSAVTRDSADMVLLDNNFAVLPDVFSEGKKIINTVWLVSGLYLTKNIAVLFLTLASWMGVHDYFLTPRSSSLISLLAVSLPAALAAWYNRDDGRQPGFIPSVLTISILYGFLLFITPFLTWWLTGLFGIDSENVKFPSFLIAAIVFTGAWFNSLHLQERPRLVLTLMALGFLYLLFAVVPTWPIPFNIFTGFYEIRPVPLIAIPFIVLIPFIWLALTNLVVLPAYRKFRSRVGII